MRAHFREAFGHLAAEADRTTADDRDPAREIEDLSGVHVAGRGIKKNFLPKNQVCLYHILVANTNFRI
jgi:hypothetical protein